MTTRVKPEGAAVTRVAALCVMIALSGCTSSKRKKPPAEPPPPPVVTARHTAVPVEIDGVLNDDAWTAATAYEMSLSKDQIERGKTLAEGGQVRLA